MTFDTDPCLTTALSGEILLPDGLATLQAADDSWHRIVADDGKTVANMRLPVELLSEVDELRGLFWVGSRAPDVSLVEFYDYNCPFCRKAAKDFEALLTADDGLRLGLVNNPILSQHSKEAALIELGVLKSKGHAAAYTLHKRLFRMPGAIDGVRALAAAIELGHGREEIMAASSSQDVAQALDRQLGLAASLALSATPSFLVSGIGIFGYPGPQSIARIVASIRQCDEIVCG